MNTSSDLTKATGRRGEEAVVLWLEREGYQIITQNFQTRLGEVDIIATRDEVMAFVEVKTRNNVYFPMSQTITYAKQQRIIKAAKYFISSQQLRDKVFRFDIALVRIEYGKHAIDYIPNAFYGS
jgi:putative endonuclease